MKHQQTREIAASIHPDAMKRVSSFFNSTITETLNELFQNARRAGATRIYVHATQQHISVTDNGIGIARPEELLAFGKTGWTTEHVEIENPAGMGLYALATWPRVYIESQPRPESAPANDHPARWSAELTPDHFNGAAKAPVVSLPVTSEFGTTIRFKAGKADTAAVRTAARWLGVPVECNGSPVCQEDFLAGAVYRETWKGVHLGVFPSRNRPHTTVGEINFHGVLVRCAENPWSHHLAKVDTLDDTWTVIADVYENKRLQLVLPARHEVVHNDFITELRTAAKHAIYRGMAAQGQPVDIPYNVMIDAKNAGISLPPPAPRLRPWRPSCADQCSSYPESTIAIELNDDAIVVSPEMERPDQQALWEAAIKANATRLLYAPEPSYQGYDWYDQLPKATELSTDYENNGVTRNIETLRKLKTPAQSCRPDTIDIQLIGKDRAGTLVEFLRLPADIVFGKADEIWPPAMNTIVAANASCTTEDIAQMMILACWKDDLEDPLEVYADEARKAARNVLLDDAEAKRQNISAAVEQALAHELPENVIAVIRYQKGSPTQVTLEHDPSRKYPADRLAGV